MPGVTCSIGPPITPANVASAAPASSTDSITRFDVVAERRDHRAVLDRRPQDRSELRPLEDEVGGDRDHGADDDHAEPVRRVVVTEDHLALEQESGRRDRVEVAAPDDRHEVLGDEEEAERQQHLVEVPAAADRTEERGQREAEEDPERGSTSSSGGNECNTVVLDERVAEVRAEQVEARRARG